MGAGFPQIYPLVTRVINPESRHTGTFIGARPLGVVVHYLADRNVVRARASDDANNLGYHLVIDRDGSIYQTAYFDRSVNHAGVAMWRGHSPNRAFAAVALASWGELTKAPNGDLLAWSKVVVPAAEAALRPNNLPDAKTAWWDKATDIQEAKLMEVLRWFVAQGVDPQNICGHDECAEPVGRKVDPGGVLSTTMKGIRAGLGTVKRPPY